MSLRIVRKEVYEDCKDESVKDRIIEEMEQVKQRDIEVDGKIRMIPKNIVKEKIGRSPDDWDSIMMREYFEIKPTYGLEF